MQQNNSKSSRRSSALASRDVTDLDLSTRPLNCLLRRGISTMEQLTAWSAEDLHFEIQGLGPGGIKEIEAALARQGLRLSEPPPRITRTNRSK